MQHDPKIRYKQTNKQTEMSLQNTMDDIICSQLVHIYMYQKNEMYIYIPYKCINTNIKHLPVGYSVVQ